MKKDIATLSRTLDIIKKYNFYFKKHLGQNFLVDTNILQKMVKSADIKNNINVIEIGPGIGSLTEQLAKNANKVVAYEIDKTLITILANTLKNYQNIKIYHEDILKANLNEMIKKEFPNNNEIVLVANLPYYITTPIIIKLLEQHLSINRYCVMMQKEVAERLCGGPNTKAYNALTITIQYYAIPQIIMNVPKTVFIPQPNVDSSVLQLKIRNRPKVCVKDEAFFFRVVKGSFIQRRKTLLNNLKQSLAEFDVNVILTALTKVNIKPTIRGEALTIEDYALLSDTLLELNYRENPN